MLCKSATRFVILHSKDLDILDVSMTQAYEIPPVETLTVQRILLFKRNQQLCVEFFKPLRKGEMYVLNLRFKSKISNRLEGFYKSYYTNKHREKRYEYTAQRVVSISFLVSIQCNIDLAGLSRYWKVVVYYSIGVSLCLEYLHAFDYGALVLPRAPL